MLKTLVRIAFLSSLHIGCLAEPERSDESGGGDGDTDVDADGDTDGDGDDDGDAMCTSFDFGGNYDISLQAGSPADCEQVIPANVTCGCTHMGSSVTLSCAGATLEGALQQVGSTDDRCETSGTVTVQAGEGGATISVAVDVQFGFDGTVQVSASGGGLTCSYSGERS